MKKKIVTLVSLLLALASTAVMATACNNNNEDNVPAGSKVYTFGAELTDLDDVEGEGWSGGESGIGMIAKDWEEDDTDWKTLTGYWVSYLYVENTALTFEITSDKAVSDAKLVLSLSMENSETAVDGAVTISPDIYTVEVNGTAVNYNPITFYDIPVSTGALYEFKRYTVATNLSLKEGVNTIKLISSNNISMGGTTRATAPLVDAIQITTSATLTWSPRTDNLEQFDV